MRLVFRVQGFRVMATDLPVRAHVDRRADAADAIRLAIAELLEIQADVLDVTLAGDRVARRTP